MTCAACGYDTEYRYRKHPSLINTPFYGEPMENENIPFRKMYISHLTGDFTYFACPKCGTLKLNI